MEKVYDNSPVGLCLQDEQLRFIRLNQLLADINGLSIEEHLGKTPRDVLPELGEKIE